MGLKGFERRLENAVEGTFARVFRSGLRPIELARRIVREMDTNRSVDVRGRTLVPNAFTILVSTDDLARFADVADTLSRELAEAVREHAHDEQYSFMGPVEVELMTGERLRTGEFRVDARMKGGSGGSGAGSLLLPSGDVYVLGDEAVVIGRVADCDITIVDGNVSRRHAEIRAGGEGFVLVDLGSTNGSKVNGVRVAQHQLVEGDELTIGAARFVFRAS